jgi:hypothetical protein
MKTRLGRYLVDYAGSGLIFSAFLMFALLACSLASVVETYAARSVAAHGQAVEVSTR